MNMKIAMHLYETRKKLQALKSDDSKGLFT